MTVTDSLNKSQFKLSIKSSYMDILTYPRRKSDIGFSSSLKASRATCSNVFYSFTGWNGAHMIESTHKKAIGSEIKWVYTQVNERKRVVAGSLDRHINFKSTATKMEQK